MSTIIVFADTNKVQTLLKAGFEKADLSVITADEKSKIISGLRKYASGEIAGHQSAAEHLLLELGDKDMIREQMKRYKGHPVDRLLACDFLSRSKQPLLIPFLAEDLKLLESTKGVMLNNEIFVLPYSVSSAQIIRAILINSPEFSSEVKNWASGLNPENREEFRTVMRQWWQENEKGFKENNYSGVKPGGQMEQKSKPTSKKGKSKKSGD